MRMDASGAAPWREPGRSIYLVDHPQVRGRITARVDKSRDIAHPPRLYVAYMRAERSHHTRVCRQAIGVHHLLVYEAPTSTVYATRTAGTAAAAAALDDEYSVALVRDTEVGACDGIQTSYCQGSANPM